MSHGNEGNNEMSIQELILMRLPMRALSQLVGYVAKLVK